MDEQVIPDEMFLIPLSTQRTTIGDYDPLLADETTGDSRTAKMITARLSDLKVGFSTFIAQVEVLLKDTRALAGDFTLDEVEVSAGVTASGSFVLFGTGAEAGMEGGIKFLFKRKFHQEQIPPLTRE